MKAEERLERLSLQLDAHPNSLSGDIEKLARDAIALLREVQDTDLEHDIACTIHRPRPTGLEEWECNCGMWEMQRTIDKFLDGEP